MHFGGKLRTESVRPKTPSILAQARTLCNHSAKKPFHTIAIFCHYFHCCTVMTLWETE